MGKTMLTIENLSAGYDEKAIVQLPRLQLEKGEACLLVGASGSGKTTLLMAIAGLATITSGKLLLANQNVTELRGRQLDRFRGRNIGFIFQDLHLLPSLSTLDNLLLAAFAAGIKQDKAKALKILDRLGLVEKAHQGARVLSRGEAQRAAIGRAMLLRPHLILADEPTASLDDLACENVLDLLQQTATETGAALIIATHDTRARIRFNRQIQVERLA